MVNDPGLQIFMVGVIVAFTGLAVYFLTAGHYEDRYKRMVRQYTFSLDTLSESNTKLRDDNGELSKKVKELEAQLKRRETANGHGEQVR